MAAQSFPLHTDPDPDCPNHASIVATTIAAFDSFSLRFDFTESDLFDNTFAFAVAHAPLRSANRTVFVLLRLGSG